MQYSIGISLLIRYLQLINTKRIRYEFPAVVQQKEESLLAGSIGQPASSITSNSLNSPLSITKRTIVRTW